MANSKQIPIEELLRLFVDFNELRDRITQEDKLKALDGNLEAITKIAEIYWNGVNGNDIQVDRYSAVNLLNYCHSNGFANATADLAVVKLSGEFGPRDQQGAINLLKQAAAQGCEFAVKKLNEMGI